MYSLVALVAAELGITERSLLDALLGDVERLRSTGAAERLRRVGPEGERASGAVMRSGAAKIPKPGSTSSGRQKRRTTIAQDASE